MLKLRLSSAALLGECPRAYLLSVYVAPTGRRVSSGDQARRAYRLKFSASLAEFPMVVVRRLAVWRLQEAARHGPRLAGAELEVIALDWFRKDIESMRREHWRNDPRRFPVIRDMYYRPGTDETEAAIERADLELKRLVSGLLSAPAFSELTAWFRAGSATIDGDVALHPKLVSAGAAVGVPVDVATPGGASLTQSIQIGAFVDAAVTWTVMGSPDTRVRFYNFNGLPPGLSGLSAPAVYAAWVRRQAHLSDQRGRADRALIDLRTGRTTVYPLIDEPDIAVAVSAFADEAMTWVEGGDLHRNLHRPIAAFNKLPLGDPLCGVCRYRELCSR